MNDQTQQKKYPKEEDWGPAINKPFDHIEEDHKLSLYKIHSWADDHGFQSGGHIYEILGHFGMSNLNDPIDLKENHPKWFEDRIKEELENIDHANDELKMLVEYHPEKRGGVPVFKGTGISISQFIAELADNQNISDISKDFSLSIGKMRKLLHALAIILDKSYDKNTIR